MFHYMKGTVTQVYSSNIVLEVNDIGYIIRTPNPYSFEIGKQITIYTYLHVREDALDLYGFTTFEEKDLFLKLISVKGIGPKGALSIVARGDVKKLEQAILAADAKYLQRFPGIGAKASSQIILDLQGKLTTSTKEITNPKIENVKEALKSLGYSASELRKLDDFLSQNIDLPIEQLVKQSLQKLF